MIRGAFNEKTKNIISPYYAKKEDQEFYKCSDPKCREPLVFCKGDVKLEYFRHHPSSNCRNYKEKITNESELHKRAKEVVKELLDNHAVLDIETNCNRCRLTKTCRIIKNNCEVVIECPLNPPYETRKADVALVNPNNDIIFIIEIYHSSKTNEENRPDDIEWCEITTKQFDDELLTEKLKNSKNSTIVVDFKCSKKYVCTKCVEEMQKNRQKQLERAIAIECERAKQKAEQEILIQKKLEQERLENEKIRKQIIINEIKLKKVCKDLDKVFGNNISISDISKKNFTLNINEYDIIRNKELLPKLEKIVKKYFPKHKYHGFLNFI